MSDVEVVAKAEEVQEFMDHAKSMLDMAEKTDDAPEEPEEAATDTEEGEEPKDEAWQNTSFVSVGSGEPIKIERSSSYLRGKRLILEDASVAAPPCKAARTDAEE